MVNFKAGGHQGEHKRGLAQQDGESDAVSKLEKMPLKGDAIASKIEAGGLVLKVVAREKVMGESNAYLKAALVHESALEQLGCRRLCRPGGDFVLGARAHPQAGPGEVLLGEAQRLSLHVCEDETYEWIPFAPAEPPARLTSLVIEAQLYTPLPASVPPVEVDAAKLGREAGKWLFDELVSDNELFIARHAETCLVLRVTALSADEADAEEEEEGGEGGEGGDAQGAGLTAHVYRGLVSPQTEICLQPSTVFKSSDSQRAVSDGLRLLGVRARATQPARNQVEICTSDGEVFPVRRRPLSPLTCWEGSEKVQRRFREGHSDLSPAPFGEPGQLD